MLRRRMGRKRMPKSWVFIKIKVYRKGSLREGYDPEALYLHRVAQ